MRPCVVDPLLICLISWPLTSPRVLAVFYDCSDFNKDLSRWDVSSVTNMYSRAATSLPVLMRRCPCLTRPPAQRSAKPPPSTPICHRGTSAPSPACHTVRLSAQPPCGFPSVYLISRSVLASPLIQRRSVVVGRQLRGRNGLQCVAPTSLPLA